jgi:RES domain-containing protein
MRAWRLSLARFSNRLDGGFGLTQPGRWNSIGRRVTYAATAPSLCVLEKLVHLDLAIAFPEDLIMVEIEIPDERGLLRLEPSDLPERWENDELSTRRIGDAWHDARRTLALSVPSVILPLSGIADRNLVLNHECYGAEQMRILRSEPFHLDQRLRPDRS